MIRDLAHLRAEVARLTTDDEITQEYLDHAVLALGFALTRQRTVHMPPPEPIDNRSFDVV